VAPKVESVIVLLMTSKGQQMGPVVAVGCSSSSYSSPSSTYGSSTGNRSRQSEFTAGSTQGEVHSQIEDIPVPFSGSSPKIALKGVSFACSVTTGASSEFISKS
jgi:hypothetical protein